MNWTEYGIEQQYALLDRETMNECSSIFTRIDTIRDYNQLKVLLAFNETAIGAHHLQGSYGYGYNDIGRDAADRVFAKIVAAEDALCRTQFVSGTHAITTALFGILRPGMRLLSVSGTPYETIQTTLGLKDKGLGSLIDFGIEYNQIELVDSKPDIATIKTMVKDTDVIYIQRSCGYTARRALSLEDIKSISDTVKKIKKDIIVVVDNCYGEFTRTTEPTEHGADLIIGSLIKNPGGGIAETGGYIAGRKDLVELCSHRLTAPGVGREVGSNALGYRTLLLGLYQAPYITGEALKSAVYASYFFSRLSFEVSPKYDEQRNDIVTILMMNTKENLLILSKAIQSASPIDSQAIPTATEMPGYDTKIVMASGAFTAGSSIELSSDAPLTAPYHAFMQGGLSLISSRYAYLKAASLLAKG
ncbi:MAG: methionine gamma-lyase family protein [Oscillospiraceae bacterium]|nr:methionine gamma-lyase family protein [Oscillospiraceae bacterium]